MNNPSKEDIKIIPIAALKDNYIWALVDNAKQTAIIIDPGEATPVDAFLKHNGLSLLAILVTHHHWDHTNGISKLREEYQVPVYGPASQMLTGLTNQVEENDEIRIDDFPKTFKVMKMPGHTLEHVAYYAPRILFCGDTLFASGCGRIFEGTAEQMYSSLQKIASLPDDTFIYCAHEYTENNLNFAKMVEPNNMNISKRAEEVKALREKKLPSLPSSLLNEKATNPFLRCESPEIKMEVEKYAGKKLDAPVDVFTWLRKWKGW
jgi:hydroxyacylglutathione hydrolase